MALAPALPDVRALALTPAAPRSCLQPDPVPKVGEDCQEGPYPHMRSPRVGLLTAGKQSLTDVLGGDVKQHPKDPEQI